MKINALNLFNNFMPQVRGGGNSAQNIQNQQFDYNNGLNPYEVLGRSQVNFTGRKNKDKKFKEYDKQFIDTLAVSMRLSDEDKNRVTNFITDYLKQKHYNTLEDIAGDDHIDEQGDFISELGDDICTSDNDYDILSDIFQDRMFYNGQYEPNIDLYQKDYEVVEHLLDKYENMSEDDKAEIFDVMKMEAERCNYNNVFELFKPENNPERFKYLLNEYLNIDESTAWDIIIDFACMAMKDEEARHPEIYPWKRTMLLNQQAKDEAIACEIIGQYDLVDYDFDEEIDESDFEEDEIDDEQEDIDFDDEDDVDDDMDEENTFVREITKELNRRRDGVSVEQISYELMEKYNLPSEAYKFIVDTIYAYDADELEDDD